MGEINPKTGLPVSSEESTVSLETHRGFFFGLCMAIGVPLVTMFIAPKVRGRKNIPKTGGVIFASNHISSLDSILIIVASRRMVSNLGKVELFKGPIGWVSRHVGIIPVDRSKKNSGALDLAIEQLKKGVTIGITPEGTTNDKDELLRFKPGAVVMAKRANVPIVPVAISGNPKRVKGTGKITLWGRPTITFGEPMTIKGDVEKETARLRDTIYNMRKEQEKKQKKVIKQSDGVAQHVVKPLIVGGIVKLVYRVKIVGKKNIPKKGGAIIVANHKHDFDPALIMSGAPKRRMHFIAKHECIEWKSGRLIGSMGVIFVDRQAEDKSDMKAKVMDFLKKDRIVALFPEGTRNKTGELLMPFHFGAFSFAQKAKVPIIPAAIVGQYHPFKKGLKIIFSKPVYVSEGDLTADKDKVYETIHKILVENGEEEHRKVYYEHYQKKAAKELAEKKLAEVKDAEVKKPKRSKKNAKN